MRYELGNMDKYPLAVMETVMENASFFKASLDEDVDEQRLYQSIKIALKKEAFSITVSMTARGYLSMLPNSYLIYLTIFIYYLNC